MKRLILWLLAAAAFQLGIYLYLDRVLLVPAVNRVTTTPVQVTEITPGVSKWPSYDGSYMADVSKDGVKIYSVSDSGLPLKQIDIGDTQKLTYFSWLQDRNIALAGISKPGTKGTIVTLKPLNMITDSKPFEPTIVGLFKGAEIVNVAFSAATNVVYIHVKSGSNSAIYRTDANNKLTRVDNAPTAIGRIANLKSEDVLLYDSINSGRAYLVDKNGKKQISPVDNSRYALIGTDKDDNIYIARLSSGTTSSGRLVDSILVGKIDGEFSVLQKMESPYPADSIRVAYDGRLLV